MNIQNNRLLSGKIFALFILLAGAALRFWQIKKYDLWFDELATDQFSFASVSTCSHFLGIPRVSVLWGRLFSSPDSQFYNFLVYIYSFFFGGWESIRYFSCVASIAAMFIFYEICRRYLKLDPQELTGAALLMAISPFQIWYAQEARGYAFSCLLILAWFLCYLSALNKKRIVPWLLFIVLSALCLLTTFYASFPIILSVLFILWRHYPVMARRARMFFLAAIILFSAALPLFVKKHSMLPPYFWLLPPRIKSLTSVFSVLIQGYSATRSLHILGVILFAGLFIFGGIRYYKQRGLPGLMLPLFFLVPIIVVFSVSRTFLPIYLERKFIIFTPFYYLCVVKGACSIKNKTARIMIWAAIFALLVISLSGYYKGFMEAGKHGEDVYRGVHKRTQYKAFLMAFMKGLEKDDIICADSINSFIIAHRYFKQIKPDYDSAQVALIYYPQFLPAWEKEYLRLPQGKGIQTAAGGPDGPLLLSFTMWGNRVRSAGALNKYKNIFFISVPWNHGDFLSDNTRAVSEFLARRCKIKSVTAMDALTIRGFECKNAGKK